MQRLNGLDRMRNQVQKLETVRIAVASPGKYCLSTCEILLKLGSAVSTVAEKLAPKLATQFAAYGTHSTNSTPKLINGLR